MTKKEIAKIIVFPLILIFITVIISAILCHPATDGEMHYRMFYHEEKNSIDVAFVGPSTVYYDFVPTYAYEKYGFTSYNYAGASQTTTVARYAISELIRVQNPKLIVVDLNSVSYTNETRDEQRLREFIDSIKPSSNRNNILKLTGNQFDLSYRIKLLNYHSNWNDITSLGGSAVINYYTLSKRQLRFKGWETHEKVFNSEGYTLGEWDDEVKPISEYSEKRLRELLAYCKTLDREIMFVRYPRLIIKEIKNGIYDPDTYKYINYIKPILAEYGFEVTDYSEDFITNYADVNLDFVDQDHLNYIGACKFTDYFSKIILERLGVNIGEGEQYNGGYSKSVKRHWQQIINETKDFYAKLENNLRTNPSGKYVSEFIYFANSIGLNI